MVYKHSKEAEELLEALLKGDSELVGSILDRHLDQGVSIQSLYIEIIGSAQCEVGEMWVRGAVTIAQEHRATQILFDHLARIRHSTRARKPLGLKAVVTSLPGDQHALGGRVVSDLLLLDGWEVEFLGVDTPISEIVRHAEEVEAHLVGLSLSDPAFFPIARQAIERLRKSFVKPKIIIGGRGVLMKENEANQLGADVTVTDCTQVVQEARRIVGVVNNGNALYQTLGEIGSRIHAFRKSQKMSQEKLANASGLDRAYISSVENGKQNVTIGALLKLTDALGVELADLISPQNKVN